MLAQIEIFIAAAISDCAQCAHRVHRVHRTECTEYTCSALSAPSTPKFSYIYILQCHIATYQHIYIHHLLTYFRNNFGDIQL